MSSMAEIPGYRRFAGLTAAGILLGTLIGVAAFSLASGPVPLYVYGGPLGARHIANPGFDPWTGVPHGRIFEIQAMNSEGRFVAMDPPQIIEGSVPDALLARRVVPIPVWIVLGSIVATPALLLIDRHRRRRAGRLPRPERSGSLRSTRSEW